VIGGSRVDFRDYRETASTLEPWLFHLQFKPPTIPTL
jgi:hypothetical protein